MKKRPEVMTGSGELRRRAEARAAAQPQDNVSRPDAQKLVHELQVHQIELEMQNEELRQARTETENLLERYTELYDYAPVGYFALCCDSKIRKVNLAGAALLGTPRGMLENYRFTDFVEPADRALFQACIDRVSAGNGSESCELALAHGGDAPRFVHVDAVADASGQDCHVTLVDITARKQSEKSLEIAASVYQAIGEAVMIADADNHILAINPAFTKITGYTPEDAIGRDTSLLKSGKQDRDFYRSMWQSLVSTDHWQGEILNRRKDGEIYLEWLTIYNVRDERGDVMRRIALFSDITDQKQARETIWRQANYDDLTGLPNRRMFRDRLEQGIKNAIRDKASLALLFLDLDHFKEVNDTLGHEMGDILLIETARRIVDCVRESDTVARLGGDEFAIVLHGLGAAVSIECVAQNIIDKLAALFYLGEKAAFVTASIGITLYPDDADAIDGLLKHADQAMYVAKTAGRNRYSYFTPALQHAAETRSMLINDLHGALAGDQFHVYFQPIVELATGAIHKAEALLRWQHPQRGLVSPAEFIPLAEETGMIIEIGDWVFREAVRQAKHLREAHHPDFQISVNMSPVQFHEDETRRQETWIEHLREQELPGQGIVVEITEGLLLDAASHVTGKLRAFRDAGMQVALDDFGTGYSALSYLKKFDIDYLKIDQTFVRNIESDANDIALCEAIIVMAHKLGIRVIAEGVETGAQRDFLQRAGCDFAQGYLYSRPLPMAQFEAFLNTWRGNEAPMSTVNNLDGETTDFSLRL